MPVAIDLFTLVAIASNNEPTIRVYSETFSEMCELPLDAKPVKQSHWSDYVFGIVDVLQRHGYRLQGADLLIHSEVPIGAGLSSSAAIEVACAYALLHI